MAPNKLTHIIHWLLWIHCLYDVEKKEIALSAVVKSSCTVRMA